MEVEQALHNIACEQRYYARYMIKILGNRLCRGSVASEQNHSCIRSHVFNDKEESDKYMEHMHVMIRDLFSNQKLHINNFNIALYGLTNRRCSYIVALDHEKTHDYTILRQVVARLSFNVYSQLFQLKQIHLLFRSKGMEQMLLQEYSMIAL